MMLSKLAISAVAVVLMTGVAIAATPATTAAESAAYTSFSLQSEETTVERTEVSSYGDPFSAFSFDIKYTLVSDYIWRGINFSEYGTEGGERLNHQLDTTITMDIATLFGNEPGQCGRFSFGTWFEWYAGQKALDPVHGGQNLQEIDFNLKYAYDIEPIDSTISFAYVWYTIANHKSSTTSEYQISLAHNDAWMWTWLLPDNEEGVLNPSVTFVQDTDLWSGGCLFVFGFSHPFQIVEDFTLTPSLTAVVDHRYYDKAFGTSKGGSTRWAYFEYGLDATYNLTPVLQLPDWAGEMSITGFLRFCDAVGQVEDNFIQDEFYGGVSLGWSF